MLGIRSGSLSHGITTCRILQECKTGQRHRLSVRHLNPGEMCGAGDPFQSYGIGDEWPSMGQGLHALDLQASTPNNRIHNQTQIAVEVTQVWNPAKSGHPIGQGRLIPSTERETKLTGNAEAGLGTL